MDNHEMYKLTERIYKSLIENFNPCTRQMITTGKTYLKTIQDMVHASTAYFDALEAIGINAQQCKGGTKNIGDTIVQVCEYYKSLTEQYEKLITMFHSDVLMKLEANIESDARGITGEQKKYREIHKTKQEPVEKLQSSLKKHHKKNHGKPDYEGRNRQLMNELNKAKDDLENISVQGLRLALLHERKRYCYVLDRNLAFLKKTVSVNNNLNQAISEHIDGWSEHAKNPEILPPSSAALLTLHRVDIPDDISMTTISSLGQSYERSHTSLQHNGSRSNVSSDIQNQPRRYSTSPRQSGDSQSKHSTQVPHTDFQGSVTAKPLRRVRALYSYISSGENQLSFNEGDQITLIVEKKDGWHYGENERTNKCGWFPVVYTESLNDTDMTRSTQSESSFKSAEESPKRRTVDDSDITRATHASATPRSGRVKSMYGGPLINVSQEQLNLGTNSRISAQPASSRNFPPEQTKTLEKDKSEKLESADKSHRPSGYNIMRPSGSEQSKHGWQSADKNWYMAPASTTLKTQDSDKSQYAKPYTKTTS